MGGPSGSEPVRSPEREKGAAEQGQPGTADRRRPRVVVGVDGSPGARVALEVALLDAVRRGAEVDVVTAYPLQTIWSGGIAYEPEQVEKIRGGVERRAREVVDQVLSGPLAGTPGADAAVRLVAVEGHAAPVLIDFAEGADLLVVGSRGRGRLRSALLGSVALHSVTHASCPVLVVRSGDRAEPPPRVVAAFDGSSGARAALAAAVDEAARVGGEVEVIACYEAPDEWTDEGQVTQPVAAVRERAQRSVADAVQEVAAGRSEVPAIRSRVAAGHPADVLVDSARGAHRLVVGSHGHGTLHGLLLGSVALHCAMQAPAPVLVVRPLPGVVQTGAVPREPAMAGG